MKVSELAEVARGDDQVQLAVVEVVVGRDRVSVGADDRERELAGVGETILGYEVIAILADEQPAGRELGCLVHRVVHRTVVARAPAGVDRPGGGADGSADAEDGDEREAVRTELESGVHVETV